MGIRELIMQPATTGRGGSLRGTRLIFNIRASKSNLEEFIMKERAGYDSQRRE